MADEKKFRAAFRKNRNYRTRRTDLTRDFGAGRLEEDMSAGQRLNRDEHSRKRTVRGTALDPQHSGIAVHLEVDSSVCRRGRVMSLQGATGQVHGDDGVVYRCAIRRILKTLSTDQRNAVAVGDHVCFRPVEKSDPPEGLIERVEPRHGTIDRAVRGRQQVLVANVDLLAIVASAAEPPLKPNLIDRMLVTGEKGGVRPLICINKVDLVDLAELQPLVGLYSQMGYPVLLLSAKTGFGIERLRRSLAGRQTVVAGQSGVGKSSLLNAVDPQFNLRTGGVVAETSKGRHTTSSARMFALRSGGYVIDTPGIRQFQLWDVVPEEIPAFFRDFRPYVSLCRFPDCTHTHEDACAVKDAVADGRLDERRYDSYCHLIAEDDWAS